MNENMWYQLPPDMTTWNTAIIGNIARKIPEITNYISALNWSRLDPSSGNADGLVELLGGTCAAPVIIRANKLAPVDTLVTNANGSVKFYPLSPAFLQKVYSDNILGAPVSNMADRDEDYIGPGQRVKNIKTVDAVKYASKEAVESIYNELVKSASVVNWMFEHMPEAFIALHERATAEEVEKTAAPEMPDLVVAWKDVDGYKVNGADASVDDITALLKFANASMEERVALIDGVPFVRDTREKIAKLHIPKQTELLDAAMEAVASGKPANRFQRTDGEAMFTSIQLKNGKLEPGILFKNHRRIRQEENISERFRNQYTSYNSELTENEASDDRYARYLFVSENGYCIAPAFVNTATVNVPIETLYNMSEPSEPALGMVGLFMGKYFKLGFGRITDILKLGKYTKVTIMNYLTGTAESEILGKCQFFEVNPDQLSPAYVGTDVPTVSFTGVNGTITRDNEGNLILDGTTYSKINCPYALMSKYAAAYDDAVAVVNYALRNGRCTFDAVEDIEELGKIAARDDNSEDKTKVDNKKTRQGTDDQAASQAAESLAPSLASITPEELMSVDFTGAGPAAPGAQGMYPNKPVTSTDLENIVAINSPQVMDAYLVGNLANSGSTTSESLMKASDSIVDALSQLSQLLFLIRQDKLDFLSESDVQAAMNKLNDVASSIGVGNVPGEI